MFFLYNALLMLGVPLLAASWGVRALFRGKVRRGLRERLGFPAAPPFSPPPGARGGGPGSPALWLHAVSVGEVHAAVPLVRALRERLPGWRLVLSTVTETGREAGLRRIPEACARIYFPLDFPWAVSAAVGRVNPRLVVILETEIWPNFLRCLRSRGIPAVIVNGRISPRSFRRYARLRPFMACALGCVAGFGMQSEDDARRVLALGAPADRVWVGGNLKFDGAASVEPPTPEEKRALRRELGFPEGGPVWVAGSVHPEEEVPVVDAHRTLWKARPDLRLILAPRHPERATEIADRLRRRGVPFRLRKSGGEGGAPGASVLVLDTLGELGRMYRAGDVAFVGGSLFPWGGQNPLEPAGLGVPVLFGEHMDNFAEAARALTEEGPAGVSAARRIEGRLDGSAKRLAEAVALLLDSPDLAAAMGERGGEVVRAQAGAAARYADWVAEIASGRA